MGLFNLFSSGTETIDNPAEQRSLSLFNTDPLPPMHYYGISDEAIIKNASSQLPKEFVPIAWKLLPFVQKWSGGAKGQILKKIEQYEKAMPVKRKLAPSDLEAMHEIPDLELEEYVPSCIYAMLNSPTNHVDQQGYSTLFNSTTDFKGLYLTGKFRKQAVLANTWICNFKRFLDAYSELEERVKFKLVAEFGISCVMFVHQKKSETRQQFKSFVDIAVESYMKAKDKFDRLPRWDLLPKLTVAEEETASGLREVRSTGEVSNAELKRHNIELESVVISHLGGETNKVIELCTDDKHVVLQRFDDEETEYEPRRVTRLELLKAYTVQKTLVMKVPHVYGVSIDYSFYSASVSMPHPLHALPTTTTNESLWAQQKHWF